MADKDEPTLEMRVAELEDKIAKMTVSEDDIAAAQKVMGSSAAAGQIPTQCVLPCIIHHQCVINPCIVAQCRPCHIVQCVQCYECSCGPCAPGGGYRGTGGFGTLGM